MNIGNLFGSKAVQNMALGTLKKAMKEAFESGDTDRFINEQARLNELQLKKEKVSKKEKPPEKTETQKQAHAGYNDAYALAVESVSEHEITPEQAHYVDAWQNEKDEQGNLKRPWAFNQEGGIPKQGSPMDIAMRELASIMTSPSYEMQPFERQLAELDRRMGLKQSANSQPVMGGNLTRPQKTNTIRLSPDIEKVAIKMKFGGPKAKSDAEHIEAYRKQMAIHEFAWRHFPASPV